MHISTDIAVFEEFSADFGDNPFASLVPDCDWSVIAPYVHAIKQHKQHNDIAILTGRQVGFEIARLLSDVHGGHATLLQAAQQLPQKTLLVCEAQAVAESIAILCPHKNVVVVDAGVLRPERDAVQPDDITRLRNKYPEAVILAEPTVDVAVKTMVDAIVPDAMMLSFVQNIAAKQVIVLPDKNIARYVAQRTDKVIIGWLGVNTVRDRFNVDMLHQVRAQYSKAHIVVHPACRGEVLETADSVSFAGDAARVPADPHQKVYLFDDGVVIEDLYLNYPEQVILPPARHRCHLSARISLPVLYQACLHPLPLFFDEILRTTLAPAHQHLQRDKMSKNSTVETPEAPRKRAVSTRTRKTPAS